MEYIYRMITPSVERGAKYYPVVVVTGPRQSGKSTLCRHIFNDYAKYNLEDIALRESIRLDPKAFLNDCGEKVIIDEVQHLPELLSYIQIIADENPERRFVLTGSSNFALMESITQSLPGRAVMFTLLPMSLNELGDYSLSSTNDLMINGFYPPVVTGIRPYDLFYPNYYSTYIERDVRLIKNLSDIGSFQKFIRLVAGRVGYEMNASLLANETGVSSPTIKSWMSLLEASYIAFLLPPYYANLNKRLTKTPKVYFYDTGLLCFLLGIEEAGQLVSHPLRGAIFENLAVIELLKERMNKGKLSNLYFYRENSGREADIIRMEGERLEAYEVKSSQTFNKSFVRNLNYLKDLIGKNLKDTYVVYDGDYIPPNIINIRNITNTK
ncbi:MAG: ATP-binding protein [Muribaculaceae bacterium]|nr:ATP-binding protein [Muribaculaceae bacterium]